MSGFIPRVRILTEPGLLYTAIGILGATVMPHNLFLHSAIVQTRNYPRTAAGAPCKHKGLGRHGHAPQPVPAQRHRADPELPAHSRRCAAPSKIGSAGSPKSALWEFPGASDHVGTGSCGGIACAVNNLHMRRTLFTQDETCPGEGSHLLYAYAAGFGPDFVSVC